MDQNTTAKSVKTFIMAFVKKKYSDSFRGDLNDSMCSCYFIGKVLVFKSVQAQCATDLY